MSGDTSSAGPVPITGVTGGSHGLAVQHEHARALAASYDAAGNRMREWAGTGGRVLIDADLLESALLAPVSFAEAELAVLGAATGPDGILVESVGWEADALVVRAAVAAYERTDELVAATFEALDRAAGRALGLTTARAVVVLSQTAVVVGLVGYAAWTTLSPAQQQAARAAAEDGLVALQEWIAAHPSLVEHLANGGGGLVDGFWSGLTGQGVVGPDGRLLRHGTTEEAAALLAGLYADDASPVVTARGDLSPHGPAEPGVPSSLSAMMTRLREVSLLSQGAESPDNGTIEVQTVAGPDGPRHVVYLPGTDDMLTTPWGGRDDDVRDMPTNLAAVGGASTTYAEGVLEAMAAAGVRPGEPVALVGHSQGGIMAAWLASHQETYEIAAVVTAGSPVGGLGPYPDSTQVLSLENHGDVIPLVEGEANPDTAGHVTVVFDDAAGDGHPLADRHDLQRYVAGAAAADASGHPSVADALRRLREAGFLDSDDPTSAKVFQVTRG